MYLTLVFAARIAMEVVEDVTLILENNKYLELKDFLYLLESKKNFISFSTLNKLDYLVYFNKNVFY